jgi:tetratricopeptide (TPR) repeat protein
MNIQLTWVTNFRVVFWFLITWVSLPLAGQNLDSLKSALVKEKGVEKRIGLLKAIGEGQMNDNPKEAILNFEELILISKQQQNKILEVYALNRIGNCWHNLNDLKQSIQFYFKALELTEEKPEYYDLKSRLYNNLGWSFKNLEDYEKALGYFITSEGYARKAGGKATLALILNNKGTTQKDLKQYDQALSSLSESLELNRETGNKRQERFNLNNIAVILIKLDRYPEAVERLRQVLVLNEELRDTVELINNLQNLGTAYTGNKNYQQAELSFLKALKYAERSVKDKVKYDILLDLTRLYQKQGKFKEAFNYFDRYHTLSDSVKTQETKRFAIELESKYNTLMKERELEKTRKELAEQKLYLTWFIEALILAVILMFFFWRVILMKRKNEKRLLDLNNEIEAQAEELRQANEEVNSINDNLEKIIQRRTEVIQNQNNRLREFAFMNAHKIRGPVASMLGIMILLKDSRNTHLTEELLQHLYTCTRNLDEVIHEVTRQLENKGEIMDDIS